MKSYDDILIEEATKNGHEVPTLGDMISAYMLMEPQPVSELMIKHYEAINNRLEEVIHMFYNCGNDEYIENCKYENDCISFQIYGISCGHGYSDSHSIPGSWISLNNEELKIAIQKYKESEQATKDAYRAGEEDKAKRLEAERITNWLKANPQLAEQVLKQC